MERFIVSARKYRPQNFSTVVGQAHITTTLKNAINNNQLAHAFLFCGPRGVGKTTCARILAKTINCENRLADGEACNECPSCISFNDGASMNIHELDAASNNSVDDIRALVEQVRFAPQAGKYKVYIIDEVHMLTSQAFNAFLKTLEEPPSYAIFILATTEKHKIIPTILSRCQIFDFKRITTNDTVQHLEEICDKEDIQSERPALQVIAQKSEGCMRDALSILDKIVSFTNGALTYQNTLEHLNILDADYYFKLLEYMQGQDLSAALLLYDDINKKGFEGDLVLNGFAEFLRNLLVSSDEKVAALLDVVESFKPKYKAAAAAVAPGIIISALNVLNEAEINYRSARNKRLHVELTLIKLCYLQQALELSMSDSGLTKKKITEAAKPLAFRGFSMIELKETQPEKRVNTGKTATEPKLIIHSADQATKTAEADALPKSAGADATGKETGADAILPPTGTNAAVPSATTGAAGQEADHAGKAPAFAGSAGTPDAGPATSPKKTGGKLTALDKIREQFANGHKSAADDQAIALTSGELQKCWNAFIEKLRKDRNPAVQSFELAILRIVNDGCFEVITGNNLEQKFIEQQRIALTEHLQTWFNNRTLTYSISIEEKEDRLQGVDIPLSSKQQYHKIIEEYPLVKELKDRLRLELDY